MGFKLLEGSYKVIIKTKKNSNSIKPYRLPFTMLLLTFAVLFTFCNSEEPLAGQPVPEDVQGRSLVPLLRDQTPDDWRESIYYHYYEYPGEHAVQRHYGVRTDRYKLIHYYQIGEWELFDLETDPNEMQSVYDDPGYEEIRNDLKEELDRLREKYEVPEEDPV